MEMNKKAGAGLIVGVIIMILFIASIIVILIVISEKPNNNTTSPSEYPMKIYVEALDSKTRNQIKANYRLEYNGTKIDEGTLSENSLTELTAPKKEIDLICWSDKYYLSVTRKTFTPSELSLNLSKVECKLDKIGNINIKHTGNITTSESIMRLNISSNGFYKNIKICDSWSPGIISAFPKEENILCSNGNWLNWTYLDKTSNTYKYLPSFFYRCGDCVGQYCSIIEKCDKIISGILCDPYLYNEPETYKRKVDYCFDTGKSLNNDYMIVEFIVKTNNLNPLDKITFYIMDSDVRFDVVNRIYRQLTETNGKDLGGKNINYTVEYEL